VPQSFQVDFIALQQRTLYDFDTNFERYVAVDLRRVREFPVAGLST